jgi:hypothetical protein
MTDERRVPKIENLQLNRETLADLTEQEGREVKGGMAYSGPLGCTGHGCDTSPPCCEFPPLTAVP